MEQAQPQRSSTIDIDAVRDANARYVAQNARVSPHIEEILKGVTRQVFQGFGSRIDLLIERMPVEQKVETLARELGWKQPRHLSEWRRAKGTLPSFDNLVRMAVLADLSLNWLIFGRGHTHLSEIFTTPIDMGATKGVTSATLEEMIARATETMEKDTLKRTLAKIIRKIDGRDRPVDQRVVRAAGPDGAKRARGGHKRRNRNT